MSRMRLVFALRGDPGYVDGRRFVDDDLKLVPDETVALNLERSEVGDDGIRQLRVLERLRCLDLDGTRITDRALSDVHRFPRLEEIWLECTNITDRGLRTLHSCRQLRFISLIYTDVSAEAIAELKLAVPAVEVSA